MKFSNINEAFLNLKEYSPKTYNFLDLIFKKYLYFLNIQNETLLKSNKDFLYIPISWPNFECDNFSFDEKQREIPLIKTILSMISFMNLSTDIFKDICIDSSPLSDISNWREENINLSEGGVSLVLKKEFKIGDEVFFYILLPILNKMIKLKGKIVRLTQYGYFYDKVSLNYEFPEGNLQKLIQNEIQHHQIRNLKIVWENL